MIPGNYRLLHVAAKLAVHVGTAKLRATGVLALATEARRHRQHLYTSAGTEPGGAPTPHATRDDPG